MAERNAGQIRRRQRRSAAFWDRVAGWVISIGGMSVLAAVLGISVYLVWVAAPLMRGGSADRLVSERIDSGQGAEFVAVDEHLRLGVVVSSEGRIGAWRLEDAAPVFAERLDGAAPTALASTPDGESVAIGLEDGTIRLGSIGFVTTLLPDDPSETDPALAREAPELVSRLIGLEPGQSEIVRASVGGSRPRVDPRGESGGVVARTDRGDLRLTAVRVDLREPARPRDGTGEITRLGIATSATGDRYIAALRADGTLSVSTVDVRESLMGGPPRVELRSRRVESRVEPADPPAWVFATGDGAHLLAVHESGRVDRYAAPGGAGSRASLELMETVEVSDGARVTSAAMLNGSLTLLVGTEDGMLSTYFVATDPVAPAPDARRLVRAHSLIKQGPAPTALGSSGRDRSLVAGFGDGTIASYHATSGKQIARAEGALEAPAALVGVAPKGDGLMALDGSGRYELWSLEPGHPAVSVRTLFGKVRYEGTLDPEYVYQSSTPESREPKLSLIPLIFGTLKATVVAMVFATPLAVGAAIYSSEFLDSGVRRAIKPTIELMASLPSVVLGFIAALVVAPLMRDVLPMVLAGFVVVPLTVVIAAVMWQTLPMELRRRLGRGTEMGVILVFLGVGALVATWAGPAMERALFRPSEADLLVLAGFHEPIEGDRAPAWVGRRESMGIEARRRLRGAGLYFRDGRVVEPRPPQSEAEQKLFRERVRAGDLNKASLRRWLDGTYGSAFPGWVLVLALPGFVAAASVRALVVDRAVARWVARHGSTAMAAWVLARFVATIGISAMVVLGAAAGLEALGMDPRDSIFGPFSLRNTLVVGLIMGFAVIPIIYTISEDALRSVPESLRLASLGAGATPWQTATRVVLPVAGSGIFSACMIGLGRAVGETMIVVMATGNTPQMGWNIFAGVRTLSANIAVELPEATQGGTHYRVLFLCGLVLFVMTFVINTTAEVVRQHFRRRNAAL